MYAPIRAPACRRDVHLTGGRLCCPLVCIRTRCPHVHAEAVLVVNDEQARPGIPAWICCRPSAVPASLLSVQDEPANADQLLVNQPLETSHLPPWFTAWHLVSNTGTVPITGPPVAAQDCLQLLEQSVASKDMIQEHANLHNDVAEDDALRLFHFASTAEAQRRAVLLLLLTFDPQLGAPYPACHGHCQHNSRAYLIGAQIDAAHYHSTMSHVFCCCLCRIVS